MDDLLITLDEAWAEIMEVVLLLSHIKLGFGYFKPITLLDLLGSMFVCTTLMGLFFHQRDNSPSFWDDIHDSDEY